MLRMLQYVKKAVILQYYNDTIMEKGKKKIKIHEASPPKSFWSWRGRLLYSSLAGIENSTDATLRKTQQQ